MNEQIRRIEYIDKLKGIAIILVVMGHVLEKSLAITNQPVNLFYNSFHMPLFMFLSGIFALKGFQQWNIHECAVFMRKKVLRILVPFISVGGLLSLLMYGDFFTVYAGVENRSFWFLPALFYCMMMEMVLEIIIKRIINYDSWYVDLLSHVIIFALLSGLYYIINPYIPFYQHFVKQYPFFVFGVFFSRYSLLEYFRKEWLYSLSVVMYFLFFYIQYRHSLPFGFGAFFAIVVLVHIFVKYEKEIVEHLSAIGKRSLHIYVFHWFLLPSLIPVGRWLDDLGGGKLLILQNGNIVIEIIIALSIAIPIVYICIGLGTLIKNSRYLNVLIFGGK